MEPIADRRLTEIQEAKRTFARSFAWSGIDRKQVAKTFDRVDDVLISFEGAI